MKLGTWLLAMMQPLIGRILTALGFSVVTIVGMEAIFQQLKTELITRVNSLPADLLAVFLLAGGGTGLSMVLAACATKLAIHLIQNSVKILGVNNG